MKDGSTAFLKELAYDYLLLVNPLVSYLWALIRLALSGTSRESGEMVLHDFHGWRAIRSVLTDDGLPPQD